MTLIFFSFCYTHLPLSFFFFFFLNDPATTEISPLPLHAPLPTSSTETPPATAATRRKVEKADVTQALEDVGDKVHYNQDRKSTRLNSSHGYISYAVFCLKKKKIRTQESP